MLGAKPSSYMKDINITISQNNIKVLQIMET